VPINSNINIYLEVFDDKRKGLVSKPVGYTGFKIIWLPPAYYGQQYESADTNIITMDPALKATDASGFVSSFFKIKTGKIGFYTVSFQFGTVFSIPIQFYTEIPITGVKVINSPTYKSGPNTNTVVFGTMPSGQPIAGVTNNYLKC